MLDESDEPTRDEKIRMAALAAASRMTNGRDGSAVAVLRYAALYENFIRTGKTR